MQMIVYEGGGHPMNQLPNVSWYLGFLLVYAHSWYEGRGRWSAEADQFVNVERHQLDIVAPVGVLDWLGTTGLTIGLILSGSAIFGIIYASVTVRGGGWGRERALTRLARGRVPPALAPPAPHRLASTRLAALPLPLRCGRRCSRAACSAGGSRSCRRSASSS